MHQPRIVLADDHPEILDAICLLLKDVGEVVERVQNGLALFEAVDRLKPGIVITDLAMPGLNGLQATRALRRARGSKVYHPVRPSSGGLRLSGNRRKRILTAGPNAGSFTCP